MEKLRPLLAVVLGLMLWVQGIAIAAAPVAVADMTSKGTDSFEAQRSPSPLKSVEMPCHGDEAPSVPPCECCDGDCTGMAGCAAGSVAGTPFVSVPAEAPLHGAIAARSWSAQTAVLPLPIRPPIVSHA